MTVPIIPLISIIACASILIFIIFHIVHATNTTIALEENVRNTATTINIMINNRSRLIKDLNTIVSNWLGHESNIMLSIKEIKSLIYRYPDLKDSSNIILMNKIESLENDILSSKALYNNYVTEYNIFIRKFPNNILSWTTKYNFKRCCS